MRIRRFQVQNPLGTRLDLETQRRYEPRGSLRFKIVEKAVISTELVRLSSQKIPQSGAVI